MPSFGSFGDRYLALVEPLNDALCEFDTARQRPGVGLVVLVPYTRDLADATRAFVEETLKVEWPDGAQDAIDEFARGLAEHEAALRAALESPDSSSFFANINAAQIARAESGPAALLVRSSLGLEGLRQTCTPP